MAAASEIRPAGMRIVEFFADTPLGEEILEGVMGGGIAGLSQVGSGKSAGQIALETAAAMLGGVAIGAAGRRIGGALGRRVHAAPLQDQGGTLAMIGRTFGNETTAKGLKENAVMGREAIKESLLRQTSAAMAKEAVADPAGFAARYGVAPEQFQSMVGVVDGGRGVAAALKAMETMTPEQRQALAGPLLEQLKKYEQIEQAIAQRAHDNFDETVRRVVSDRGKYAQEVEDLAPGMGEVVDRLLQGLDRPVQAVTGEHVGKAIGRFMGDEVGVLGGLAAGSLLAQQLGIENPKDQRIRELEQQLAGRG